MCQPVEADLHMHARLQAAHPQTDRTRGGQADLRPVVGVVGSSHYRSNGNLIGLVFGLVQFIFLLGFGRIDQTQFAAPLPTSGCTLSDLWATFYLHTIVPA